MAEKKRGFLAEALRRISRPIRTAGASAISLGQQVFDPALRGDPTKMSREELARVTQKYKKPYEALLTEGERKQTFSQSPVEAAARQTAGLASLLIPGGATAKTAIGLGGLAGGLSSVAEDEDVFSGVAGGLVGGGLGFGAGKLPGLARKGAGRISDIGKGVSKSIVTPKTGLSPTFAREAAELSEKAAQFGLKGSGAAQAKQLSTLYDDFAKQVTGVAKQSQSRLDTTGILDDFANRISQEVDDVALGAAGKKANLWSNKLKGLGDDASVEDLLDLKFDLQGRMKGIYKKLDTGKDLLDKEQVLLQMHNALDDAIKTAEPRIADTLSQMTDLYKITPGVKQAATKPGGIPIPGLFGTKVGGQQVQAAKAFTGEALERFGTGLGGIPGLGGSAQQAAQLAGRQAGIQGELGAGEEPAIQPGAVPGLQGPEAPQVSQQDIWMKKMQLAQIASQYPEIRGQIAVANQMLDAQMEQLEAGGVGGEPLDKTQAAAQTGLSALDEIERNLGSLGRTKVFGGIGSPEARQLQNAMEQAADIVGRIRTGAAINEEERKQFIRFLPSVVDDAETKQKKLDLLREEFSSLLGQ